MLKQMALTSIGLPVIDQIKLYDLNKNDDYYQINMKGNINHSVCKWCYSQISLEEFSIGVKSMGITGIDLIGPGCIEYVDMIKKLGKYNGLTYE